MRASSSASGLPLKQFLFISLLWSCSLLDPPLSFGNPRAEDQHRSRPPHGEITEDLRDTLFIVSAVCFPESYDWQRDSAYGNVSCTLRLFCGEREMLSIPAGPGTTVSASPDGHHIIDGELYTVYADPGGTYIGRGGTPLAHWVEKEYIVGLLPSGNDVFTLGLCQDGGLAFRCNGREHFRDAGGVPFGGFGSDTYGPGGALYMDGGSVCFAYCRDGSEAVFVRDGEKDGPPFSPSESTVLDARYINGAKCVLYNQAGTSRIFQNGTYITLNRIRFIDAGLVELGGTLFCAGWCMNSYTESECRILCDGSIFYFLHGSPERLYFCGAQYVPLYLDQYPGCRFFGRNCARALNGNLAVALTPRDGSAPFVSYKGTRTEYPVHGFLSGIDFHLPE